MPLDLMTRRAAFRPSSLNRDNRTVRVTVSTGAAVQRRGYIERLTLPDPQTIVGLPVLNTHRQDGLDNLLGRVVAAGVDDAGLWADVQISERADWLLGEIEAGIVTSASIGYRQGKATRSTDPATGQPVRTITPEISEISFVPVPADKGATIRSNQMENDEITVEDTSTETRDDDRTQTRAAIRQIARSAGLTSEQADDMVDRELSITEARAEAFVAMQDRGRTTPRIRTATSEADNPATVLQRRADALFARVNGEAPSEEARPYMNESLRDMARACVEATGTSTRAMDADQLFRAAMHTTSDFPQLLTSTGNRTLVAAYQAAQSPVKTTLARQSTLADFRPGTRLRLSDVGTLSKVSESGEITHTSRAEASESYALDTYATQFAISRKALINDDLGAFRDWGATAGRMAAETEANLMLSLLLGNPTMGEDGKALFHADHGNLAAGSALEIAALDAARKAMRGMKALDGKTPINATPRYLLVGPELETTAEQILASIYAATVADANPFTGRLTLLVEPRIADESFYIFADPGVLPVLEYSYLSSAQGPQMASREGWDVLGMEFRVVLDFGCGAVDWRGAYLNPGA
ncbi:Mu-like prophage major head subunit gpT family protein [Lutimaribacter sp. EGI FJ00015]|uniref:Mu-like prophage major head subunit gpT family protein n=1 Tax=Lutimaribacter degradans TaxID=2945989 RepID=A0ACC5ZWF3_9RHOB|nr:prohead protease/major capsid protein fusion protein [Lutimaribacter sp. EGI FJ00013]MCM2562498.1 Mu-like prophage major head subunit gpT family protein [Lutimaribacter sp. EGI FJ00013]MCO0613655.1 Mu-like prophage major head subunit gpT family protein [Lutimaribacter sp. EGI FJ00015]MCO0636627.1 Mu-like prophage major head subunit gpT family protein [Lutimaribacter sp. EGI FJ00014]